MATSASHLILTSHLGRVGSLLPTPFLGASDLPISHPQIHTAQFLPLASGMSDQLSAGITLPWKCSSRGSPSDPTHQLQTVASLAPLSPSAEPRF